MKTLFKLDVMMIRKFPQLYLSPLKQPCETRTIATPILPVKKYSHKKLRKIIVSGLQMGF